MRQKLLKISFFIVVLLGTTYAMYAITKPFLSALFLAVVASIIFYPLFVRFELWTKGRRSLASFLTVIVASLAIAVPLLFFASIIFNQAYTSSVALTSSSASVTKLDRSISELRDMANRIVPGPEIDFASFGSVREIATKALSFLITNADSIATGLFRGILNLFIFILAFFYILRDGDKLIATVVKISPLNDSYDKEIGKTIGRAINSVIKGYLVVALVQGLVSGVGYMFFGLPAPAIWGFAAGLAALVPSLGTGLVSIPAIIYLFATGHTIAAILLILWSVLIVGLIDNILAPSLINKGMAIHPFLILISILGGVSLFGPVGFIAGPVTLSLLSALLHMYPLIMVRSEDRIGIPTEQ